MAITLRPSAVPYVSEPAAPAADTNDIVQVTVGGTFEPGFVAEVFYQDGTHDPASHHIWGIHRLGRYHLSQAVQFLGDLINHSCGPSTKLRMRGHSQGGTLALHYACLNPERVISVATWGAPNNGSPLCKYWMPVAAARCMTPSSRYNQELAENLVYLRNRPDCPTMTFYSSVFDVFVPFPAAYVRGADNALVAPGSLHRLLRRRLPDDVRLLKGCVDHIGMPRARSVQRDMRAKFRVHIKAAA